MTRDEQEYILTCADRYLSRLFQVVSFLGDAALTAAPILQRVAVQTPEQAAAHLRTLLGLPMTGPVGNITDMLENKGFIVCPVDVPESKFSGNSGYANGRPYITVNTTMPAERQRFTLIHELAHLVFVFEEGQDEASRGGIDVDRYLIARLGVVCLEGCVESLHIIVHSCPRNALDRHYADGVLVAHRNSLLDVERWVFGGERHCA